MRREHVTRHEAEGGFVLIAGLFLVFLVGALAVGLLEEGETAKKWLSLHEHNLQALELAETGLIRAEMEIRAQIDHGADGIGVVSGAMSGGTFEVTLHDDPVSADRWILQARGDYGYAVRHVEIAVRRRASRHFVEGLFAKDELILGGNVTTDAYDSALGTYASQAVKSDTHGTYASLGGHVGSNADISLKGSSTLIRGNAIPGPFRQVNATGHATALGDMMPRLDFVDLLPESFEAFQLAYLNHDNDAAFGPGGSSTGNVTYTAATCSVKVTGNGEVVLPAGTYFFRDFEIKGNSNVRITGPVDVYVTGSFDLGGGAVVNNGPPADFKLHAHPYALPPGIPATTTTIDLHGGALAAMAIYAPEADLTIGGGDELFGSAVARTIDVKGNCSFHYDAALGRIGLEGVARLERLYWRDLAPPNR